MSEWNGRCAVKWCDAPATVELILTFTDGKTLRIPYCAAHEAESRTLVKPTRKARKARKAVAS